MHLIVLPVVVLGSLSKQQKRSYRRWGDISTATVHRRNTITYIQATDIGMVLYIRN